MSVPLRTEHLQERIREIRAYVERIQRYTALSDEAFFADERNLYTVELLLLRCIEAAASICSHIMARIAQSAPSSYVDCFEGLREAGVIDDEVAAQLMRAARFRNMLVHHYWNVDERQVLQIARRHAEDFIRFTDQIVHWQRQREREE